MRLVSAGALPLLLTMVSSGAAAAHPEERRPRETFAPSALTVAITVHAASVDGRRQMLVDFEFKNPTSKDERLENWLALEPKDVTMPLLRISRSDGSAIAYVGRLFRRGRPGSESYVRIASGETRVVRGVDVTAVYDWPKTPQRITVRYEALTMAHGALRLLQSRSQSLDYVPLGPSSRNPAGNP